MVWSRYECRHDASLRPLCHRRDTRTSGTMVTAADKMTVVIDDGVPPRTVNASYEEAMMERFLGQFSPYLYAVMRIVVGLLFACHGAQKLFGVLGGFGQPGATA